MPHPNARPRVYPSWLPANPRERLELRRLRRRQALVLVWLIAMIPAGWVAVLLMPDLLFVPLTLAWLALGLWMASRVSTARCPRCAVNFCPTAELPYWYGPFNQRCQNCGLGLRSPSVS
ncbi:MAG TPA: hypothetical protein VJN94_15205 [Candidatus Binataceae bacterium]|nr:hypothetical protein [Candidatus Binataceae bacterium]